MLPMRPQAAPIPKPVPRNRDWKSSAEKMSNPFQAAAQLALNPAAENSTNHRLDVLNEKMIAKTQAHTIAHAVTARLPALSTTLIAIANPGIDANV
mmetsp:Transcript_13215/g.21471  ORF Transcript_13215/g.21471 Transcript_13215/m.21471 type:complete len:96 (-) Transcript_13215:1090-1377(-)